MSCLERMLATTIDTLCLLSPVWVALVKTLVNKKALSELQLLPRALPCCPLCFQCTATFEGCAEGATTKKLVADRDQDPALSSFSVKPLHNHILTRQRKRQRQKDNKDNRDKKTTKTTKKLVADRDQDPASLSSFSVKPLHNHILTRLMPQQQHQQLDKCYSFKIIHIILLLLIMLKFPVLQQLCQKRAFSPS